MDQDGKGDVLRKAHNLHILDVHSVAVGCSWPTRCILAVLFYSLLFWVAVIYRYIFSLCSRWRCISKEIGVTITWYARGHTLNWLRKNLCFFFLVKKNKKTKSKSKSRRQSKEKLVNHHIHWQPYSHTTEPTTLHSSFLSLLVSRSIPLVSKPQECWLEAYICCQISPFHDIKSSQWPASLVFPQLPRLPTAFHNNIIIRLPNWFPSNAEQQH